MINFEITHVLSLILHNIELSYMHNANVSFLRSNSMVINVFSYEKLLSDLVSNEINCGIKKIVYAVLKCIVISG